jgi:hypothetical protein
MFLIYKPIIRYYLIFVQGSFICRPAKKIPFSSYRLSSKSLARCQESEATFTALGRRFATQFDKNQSLI